jgi:hypothetical protein
MLNFASPSTGGPYIFGPSSQLNSDYIEVDGSNLGTGTMNFLADSNYTVKEAVWNNGGTVQFKDGSVTDFPYSSAQTGSWSFRQVGSSASTTLGESSTTSGATVTCDLGFRMDAGELAALGNGTGNFAVQPTQKLNGGAAAADDIYITGGTVWAGADGSWAILKIGGWGIEINGTGHAKVNVNSVNAKCSELDATNNISVSSTDSTFADINLIGTSSSQKNWSPFNAGLGDWSGQFNGNTAGFTLTVDGTGSQDQLSRP